MSGPILIGPVSVQAVSVKARLHSAIIFVDTLNIFYANRILNCAAVNYAVHSRVDMPRGMKIKQIAFALSLTCMPPRQLYGMVIGHRPPYL